MMGKKGVNSILNKIRYSMLNFYLNSNIIVHLYEIYQHYKIESDQRNIQKIPVQLMKLWFKLKWFKTRKKLFPKEFIAEKAKLRRKKYKDYKQTKSRKIKS